MSAAPGARPAHGALFTDFYALTMAQLYWREGFAERPAQFEYFFRNYPDYGGHAAGYAVAAGLAWFLDWLETARFEAADVEALRGLRGGGGAPLFAEAFLTWLEGRRPGDALSVRAVPEGRVVHAGAPVLTVRGPLADGQLLEAALLNHLNYPTLVASKAARLANAARSRPVLDFGMRRGHERGVDAGSRGALIGGAAFTSNTGLAFAMGTPPKGTHAHSLVQAHLALGGTELDAFRAYASAYPDDTLLLVDTVDTLNEGVPHAITVFEELRARGHEPLGIRLDSGDLAYLAIQSARQLDDAGFPDATIVLSNALDEVVIWQILAQIDEEAERYGVDPARLVRRLSFGVGTRLVTSAGDAALDGVYKLVAVRDDDDWRPAAKLSDSPEKELTPGDKDVWRLYDTRGKATADLVTLAEERPAEADGWTLHHPTEPEVSRSLSREQVSQLEPLLEEAWRHGARAAERPELEVMRRRRWEDVERLDPGVRRLVNPHRYHVSLSEAARDAKRRAAREARTR